MKKKKKEMKSDSKGRHSGSAEIKPVYSLFSDPRRD